MPDNLDAGIYVASRRQRATPESSQHISQHIMTFRLD